MELLSIEEATYTDDPNIIDMVITVSGLGSGIPFTYDPSNTVGITPEVTRYLAENPDTVINPYVPPEINLLRDDAKQSVIEFSNQVTEPILRNYSESEILGWERKGREAELVVTKDANGETLLLSDAPNIVRKLKRQFPEDTDADILTKLLGEATAIHGKATLFNTVMDYLEILRVKAFTGIEAATNETEINTLLTAIKTEAIGLISSLGLPPPE